MTNATRFAMIGLLTALFAGHPALALPDMTSSVGTSGVSSASQGIGNVLVSTTPDTSVVIIDAITPNDPNASGTSDTSVVIITALKPSDPTGLAAPLPVSLVGGTLSVPVLFSSQSWGRVGEVSVNTCPAPKDRSYLGPLASEIRLLDRNGKVLRTRRIGNPRVQLIEDPKREPGLAERAKLVLQIGYEKAAETLELWEDPKKQGKPSLVVDLSDVSGTSLIIEGFKPVSNGCRHFNPMFVEIGNTGKFVLPHAIQRASDVSGVPVRDLVVDMARNGGKVSPKLKLPSVVKQLLERSTVGR